MNRFILIGISVVVVVGIGILGVNIGQETPQRIIQEDTREMEITSPAPTQEKIQPFIESQDENSEIFIEEKNIDDEILTYKIDNIPEKIKHKEFIKEAVHEGLNLWTRENPELVFEEITEGEPDIHISWIEFEGTHMGLGCLDCLKIGATIEVVLEQPGCTGEIVQYDKGMITNIVAHEFGHNLGLEHNDDENHLMWSDNNIQTPYDTLGYNIPNLVPEYFLGYEDLQDEITDLANELDMLDEQIKQLTTNYEKHEIKGLVFSESSSEYNNYLKAYHELVNSINNYNSLIKEINLLLDEWYCVFTDSETFQNNRLVSIHDLQNKPIEIEIDLLPPKEAKQKEIECEKEVEEDNSLTFAEKIVQKRNCETYGNRYG